MTPCPLLYLISIRVVSPRHFSSVRKCFVSVIFSGALCVWQHDSPGRQPRHRAPPCSSAGNIATKHQYNAIIYCFICVLLAVWAMNRNVKHGFTETYRVLFTFHKGAFCGTWQGVQLFRLWPQFILALLGGVYTVNVPFFRMVPCFLLRPGGIRVCSPRAIFVGAEMLLFAREAAGLFFRGYNMTRWHIVRVSARVVHLRSAGRSCAHDRTSIEKFEGEKLCRACFVCVILSGGALRLAT